MKTISYIPPAPGQEVPEITNVPRFMDEKLREIADDQYGRDSLGLTPATVKRAAELLPRIYEDCMKPSETWPPYMPDMSRGCSMLPDYPWMRCAWGAFTFEAIVVAASIAGGKRECPSELAA